MGKVDPRPDKGPMPSPKGDEKPVRDSDASTNPGYEIGKSLDGTDAALLKKGYTPLGGMGDAAKSDPLDEA